MKYIAVFSILIYKFLLSPLIKQTLGIRKMCKYSPTCSSYAIEMFRTHSFLTAGKKTTLRILSCK